MLNSEKMLASLAEQDLGHADTYFKKALKEDPSPVLLELGTYLEGIGFYPQAKEIYLKVQNEFPEVAISLAQIAAEDGDIEEAFLYLEQIEESSPFYIQSLMVMADLYQMEGLADVAREKLLKASALSQDALIVLGLAEIELELEYYDAAISRYASLDNRHILEETGISTYERIGRCYAELGKFEAAIEFMEKAIEIAYDDYLAYELAVLCYEQGEYQRAILYFKQLETLSPDFEGYHYVYALSLQADHQIKEALLIAQQGIAKNAFDVTLLLLGSQLAYETHDKEMSENYLLQAKDVSTDLEEVFLRLSNLYLEDHRYEELIKLDQEEIDHVLTKWHIAKAYHALDKEETFGAYDALWKDLQQNPEFLEEFFYLLREQGDRSRAIAVAKAYLAIVPDDENMVSILEDFEND